MSKKHKIDYPFTAYPNYIIDVIMPLCAKSPSAFMVATAVIRQTIGWEKPKDIISLSQFVKLTGLSNLGVRKAIKWCLDNDLIEREKVGQSFRYRLHKDRLAMLQSYTVTELHSNRVTQDYVTELHGTMSQSNTELCNRVTTQKKEETIKETNIYIDGDINDFMDDMNAHGDAIFGTPEKEEPKEDTTHIEKLSTIYNDVFKEKVRWRQINAVANEVTDYGAFTKACLLWNRLGYKITNFDGLLNCYRNLLKDPNWHPYNNGNGRTNGKAKDELTAVWQNVVTHLPQLTRVSDRNEAIKMIGEPALNAVSSAFNGPRGLNKILREGRNDIILMKQFKAHYRS